LARGARGLDGVLALLLFTITALYVVALPLSITSPDENNALHQAKRLLDGEVMYRDIFDPSMPGWMYLLAGVFGVFGTTLAVARCTAAVIWGGTTTLVFLACRVIGVRRSLAWATGFACLAVCFPFFPIASYHWLSTFLSVVLLVLCLRPTDAPSWAFVLGLAAGLLCTVHQQRGLAMGLAIPAFLVAEMIVARRYGASHQRHALLRRLGASAAGGLLIVGSLLVALGARAGIRPLWDSLVVFPMVSYRAANTAPWGSEWGPLRSVGAIVVTYLPVILVITVTRLLVLWWRRDSPERARILTLLTVFGVCSIFSISYNPDAIHLALIAPLFIIALAESLEHALRPVPRPMQRALAAAAAIAVVLSSGRHLYGTLVRLRGQFSVPYQSAFGRVDLMGPRQAQMFDQLRALLDAEPSATLFCYPFGGAMHLVLGSRNPTRYELVLPGPYTPPSQTQEIVDALTDQRVRYVLAPPSYLQLDEPLARFIREHYAPAVVPPPLAGRLLQRKDDVPPVPSA
jgi:hypothetical protein